MILLFFCMLRISKAYSILLFIFDIFLLFIRICLYSGFSFYVVKIYVCAINFAKLNFENKINILTPKFFFIPFIYFVLILNREIFLFLKRWIFKGLNFHFVLSELWHTLYWGKEWKSTCFLLAFILIETCYDYIRTFDNLIIKFKGSFMHHPVRKVLSFNTN